MRDPTYNHIAYHDAISKGLTCRHCTRWRKSDYSGEEFCEIGRDNFPRICKDEKFEIAEAAAADGARVD